MRRILNLMAALIVVIILTVYYFRPTPQWCFQQGVKCLDNTSMPNQIRYYKANLFFKFAIYLDPKYVDPYYDLIRDYLSMAYLGTDDDNKDVYDPAGLALTWQWIKKAEALAPDTGELHFCQTKYYLALKQFDEATKEIERAIALDPKNGRYFLEKGKNLFEQYLETEDRSYASRAIKEFKKSLDCEMKKRFRASALDYLGLAYDLAFNKKVLAQKYYAKSQLVDPTDYISRMHYTQVSLQVDQNAEDETKRAKNYRAAVQSFTVAKNMEALYNTARNYLEYCDYPEAEAVFKQVIQNQPKNYEAIYMLGQVYLEEGEFEKALEQFHKALAVNGKYADVYASIGYVYNLQNDIPASNEANLKCISYDPNNLNANYNLGMNYYSEGKIDIALKYYVKCLEINPRDSQVYYWIGFIYYQNKEKATAEEYFRKAVDLSTDIEDCYFRLSQIYNERQDYRKAIPLLERVLKMEPYPLIANNLAWCYVCLNENQEDAVELAEYAVSVSPDNHAFLDTLNKAYINLGNKYKNKGEWISAWQCYRKAKKTIKRDYS